MIEITPLRAEDRAAWQALGVGYNTFYERTQPDEIYERVWRRLMTGETLHGLGARLDGRLVGITHYYFHTSVWTADVCYLADLFTDETLRGKGVARALIEAVAVEAKKRGSARLYWQTRESNTRARALYDKVARFDGFIRYDYPL